MKLRHIILVIALLISALGGQAQTKQSLQSQIDKLQKEITTANKLLKETSKNKQATANEVALLNKKINQRKQLITAYNQRIAELDRLISNGEKNIKQMNIEIKKLRQEYAQMVTFAYKNRSSYDKLVFLFASDDFNQAFRRLRYIQQFSNARRNKVNQIREREKKVGQEVENNKKARLEQSNLLLDEKKQQDAMSREKDELNGKIASLKKQEGKIQQDIKNKKQQSQKLQKKIDAIIAEEIRKAKEKAAKEAAANKGGKTNTSSNSVMALTPAEKALSNSFASNKGKLPWPTPQGMISSSFGKHAHPVSDKIVVTNNGIDIATPSGTMARAVFDGEVVSVSKITATNNVVIIRHGEYFTVYSNLESVSVSKGTKVKTKQNIGRIYTDKEENKTELHFELYQAKDRKDPAQWLAK